MSSRDIWSKGGNQDALELLASLLGTLLIQDPRATPLYICSPYLSDFVLLGNQFQQYSDAFNSLSELADRREILFSEVLRELSFRLPVRVVTIQHPSSRSFVARCLNSSRSDLSIRFAASIYHEKGLLCDDFYLAGSMNFTYSGVYIRDEKITCYFREDPEGQRKIDAAFLEFDLLWNNLNPRDPCENP